MPELPDVQVAKEYVDATSLHRTVARVEVDAEHELHDDLSPRELTATLRGRTLSSTRRHGKHLFVKLGQGPERWLRLHFGMTGTLDAWEGDAEDAPGYTRLRLDFDDDRHLAYRCPRRLGEIQLLDDPDAFIADLGLGPDPWGRDDPAWLVERLDGRRGFVKTALMDQSRVAGLGNVYVDEILFRAGVHPRVEVAGLGQVPGLGEETREEDDGRRDDDGGNTPWRRAVHRLHATLQEVLVQAVRDFRADPSRMPDSWLLPAREEGRACPRCDGALERSKVGGRTTYACPGHQPPP